MEATGWRVFVTHQRANKKGGKNAVSLVRTNSHCKGEVVVHVQQKFPLLYPYFYPCPIALWTSLQLENMSSIEMNTDWKFLHFHGTEKAIKLAKK